MNGSGVQSGASEEPQVATAEVAQLTCFIVCPIGEEGSETRLRSDQIKRYVIDPAIEPFGYKSVRSDLVDASGIITTQIVDQLINADLVVADLAGHNPNVLYELAIRHTVGKPFIQIAAKGERSPFDVAGQRTIFLDYKDLDSANDAKTRIGRAVEAIRDGGTEYKSESPVSHAVDLQYLRQSGDVEQITLADVSEALADIRSELRISRVRTQDASGFTAQQTATIRTVLLHLASTGRLTEPDFEALAETAPRTKAYSSFLGMLREEMDKPIDDPWGPSPTRNRIVITDDEPPF